MHCALCQLAPREDDPTATTWVEGQGMVAVCTPCLYGGAAIDNTYPPGVPVPRVGDRDVRICACCRRALRQGEEHTPFRLTAEDVQGTRTPHGVLHGCQECLERWRPAIARRTGTPNPVGNQLL